jgi:RNA polymerase sigma factor (sigma-70 family)
MEVPMYAGHTQKQEEVRETAARLFAEEGERLVRFARRNGRSRADAEEAVQDVLVSFIEHFDPDRGSPPIAWLMLALKRRCWRLTREAHYERRVSGDEESETEEPRRLLESVPAGGSGTEKQVVEVDEGRRRLASLSPDQRDALGLHAAGMTYPEIGRLRGWTRTKTDRCLRRGRARLRAGEPAPR